MSVITCRRCGTEFDTERDPVTPHQNTERCSSCGYDHSEPQNEAQPTKPVAADESPAVAEALPIDRLADAEGDVHLHVHYHGDDEGA